MIGMPLKHACEAIIPILKIYLHLQPQLYKSQFEQRIKNHSWYESASWTHGLSKG